MFRKRASQAQPGSNFFARLLWRGAWVAQFALWGFLLLFVLHYWIVEVPAVRGYHAAGLAQGFDGLAGITASIDPEWRDLSAVRGHAGGNRFTRLQGDTTFKVWLELDEMPAWNSGLAQLRFNREGKLIWARRYLTDAPKVEFAENRTSGELFPVVYAWAGGASGKTRLGASPLQDGESHSPANSGLSGGSVSGTIDASAPARTAATPGGSR